MERTRAWYRALGYERDYIWASADSVPFAPLSKPLSECTAALIGTATPIDAAGGPRLPKHVYSLPTAAPPSRLYTDDLSWDKGATHTDDRESFMPIDRVQQLVERGRLGALARRFHGVPTEYSQRRTIDVDAPEILRRCREDEVDVALLVPL
jgi:D-proline reductase (dithiol) PrdB